MGSETLPFQVTNIFYFILNLYFILYLYLYIILYLYVYIILYLYLYFILYLYLFFILYLYLYFHSKIAGNDFLPHVAKEIFNIDKQQGYNGFSV